jgi:hypothetical protein
MVKVNQYSNVPMSGCAHFIEYLFTSTWVTIYARMEPATIGMRVSGPVKYLDISVRLP